MFGEAIARAIGRGEMAGDLGALADDPPHVPPLLRDRIMGEWGMWERLAASEYCDADGAFWQGFVEGVRAYVTDVQLRGMERHPSPTDQNPTSCARLATAGTRIGLATGGGRIRSVATNTWRAPRLS